MRKERGAILLVAGVGVLFVGILVTPTDLPVGSLLGVAGVAGILVGTFALFIPPGPTAQAYVCYICGGSLYWVPASGRWWCERCADFR